MEEDNPNKRKLDLDWTTLLAKNDDEPPPLLIIKQSMDPPKPSPSPSTDNCPSPKEDFSQLSDESLDERIERQRNNVLNLGPKLPDNGEKLRANIKVLEEERHRRKLHRAHVEVDVVDKSVQSISKDVHDDSNVFRQDSTPSQVHPESTFKSIFSGKMEENKDGSVFDKELSILSHCNHQKMKPDKCMTQRERKKRRLSLKQYRSKSAVGLSLHGDKFSPANGDEKARSSAADPLQPKIESFSKKKDEFQVLPLNGSRHKKGQTVVFVDEDETHLMETKEQDNELAECMKDASIYYPSRDDPQSVEISYADTNCLAPDGFLTSPIMNFYIRYLQQQATPTNRATCDYHIFNTFFYEKLKQAVSYKGSDKESFFIKFRRWWKGVNIFQKAYVLIPINEDLHWSLVIICIPDKEDESGPIILHLDSLGLHYSRLLFDNIRSYLIEEWKYMNQEVAPSNLPIADRIDDKIITVPQQKNDYDCGLFVLFFMERFIEEAPERLKKNNLAMFGKKWFRPEEASSLRVKIRNLLKKEFQNARKDSCIQESSPSRKDSCIQESSPSS